MGSTSTIANTTSNKVLAAPARPSGVLPGTPSAPPSSAPPSSAPPSSAPPSSAPPSSARPGAPTPPAGDQLRFSLAGHDFAIPLDLHGVLESLGAKPASPRTDADQALRNLKESGNRILGSIKTRSGELDQLVKSGQIDKGDARAERLKLDDTATGVQRLMRLAASLPTDLNPEAAARFKRLHELVEMVGNGQIDGEQARAEAHSLATSLRTPDSDAPGPLQKARDAAVGIVAAGEATKNDCISRMRELQQLVMDGKIDADDAQNEMNKLSDTYKATSGLQQVVERAPIDRDPKAAATLGRLAELGKMIGNGQVDGAQAAAEVYMLTQRLEHPALFPGGKASASVQRGASEIQNAMNDRSQAVTRIFEIQRKVSEGKLDRGGAELAMRGLERRVQAAEAVAVRHGLPLALVGGEPPAKPSAEPSAKSPARP